MGRALWSNEKLLSRLIANRSEKTYWLNIAELRKRGTVDFFEQCVLLTESNISKERMIGVDILSQLSNIDGVRLFSEKAITHFLNLLKAEKDPLVIMSILYGIGHNSENLVLSKDIEYITEYQESIHSYIRNGVVFALLGIDNGIAIDSLVRLSRDKFSNIRNWAVFGLGSLIERDTTEIRQALYARIHDKHQETREEAILGLAKRSDTRIRNVIMKELLSESYSVLLLEAIEELQDIEFIPLLESHLMKYRADININDQWTDRLEYCIGKLKSIEDSNNA